MAKWDELHRKEQAKYLELEQTEDDRRAVEALNEDMENFASFSNYLTDDYDYWQGRESSRYRHIFEEAFDLDRHYTNNAFNDIDFSIQQLKRQERDIEENITVLRLEKNKVLWEEEEKKYGR